jgi:CheY-like chemotaxis protein
MILLVEDSDEDAELTIRALKRKRLAAPIHRVADGAAAIEFLGSCEERPQVVLLDLKLPKMDGLQVLRRIKTNPNTQAVPVVMLTSSREDKDVIESYRLGVNSYIVKPVDFDKFVEAVEQIGVYWSVLNEPRPK